MKGQETFIEAASMLSPEPKTAGGFCLLWGDPAWCGCLTAVRLGEQSQYLKMALFVKMLNSPHFQHLPLCEKCKC